ncbi:hypothetical protein EJ05DRAFT_184449 [Pseudovirgaria hyperparasitica]|uniref:HMG box domain-containing protein n=1 Tax=Pseudovirgaria hyperparasitica TaxID=470096 RepID=A0A6A6WG06_9PEZI|nr:uncharacterized protein EJ05DRAFT_184449 [Pseudovirgaria hyperparasitica]KAF2761762.1 hypothetical protein EJ05DRAFT_184449 [Pseudovirgaria hyperparasitica]
MRVAPLVHQQPPTPPMADQELQYNSHHLAHHTTDQGYMMSRPNPSYDSPMQHHHSYYSPVQYHTHLGSPVVESGIQFGGYSENQANPYPMIPGNMRQLQQCSQSIQGNSPPTPRSRTGSELGGRVPNDFNVSIRQRMDQGYFARSMSRTSSPQVDEGIFRPKLQPKARRSKTGKTDMPKTPKLTAPLSILTHNLIDVPVKDMETWVNRPLAERRIEVEKRNGYVSRPMNCFMLYRSAYQERTKVWCVHNNHQVVSSVTGASWPMEPAEVQEHYKELAKIERKNHAAAFPHYKFSPSKSGVAPRKRKKESSEAGDTVFGSHSEFDDDGTNFETPKCRGFIKRFKNEMDDVKYDPGSDFGSESTIYPQTSNVDIWRDVDTKPLPNSIATGSYDGVYTSPLQSTVALLSTPQMQLMDYNSAYYAPVQTLLSMPEQQHGLFQVDARTGTPIPEEGHVDPMLITRSPDGSRLKQEYDYAHDPVMTQTPFYHNGMGSPIQPSEQEYKPAQHIWQQSSPTAMTLEHESEYNKWYD